MKQWFYLSNGAQQGPVAVEQFAAWATQGQFNGDVVVWSEGMAEWVPANQVPELAGFLRGMQPGFQQPGMQAAPLSYGHVSYSNATPFPGAYPCGFWWRVLAALLDGLALFLINFPIGLLLGASAGIMSLGLGSRSSAVTTQLGIQMLATAIQICIEWLYFSFQESSAAQATLGKRICGIIVTDLQGKRLTYGRATGRYFGRYLSFMICGIGVIMVAFNSRKQGLHDQMAGTLVWKKP